MGFHRVKDIIDTCYDGGQNWTSSFTKQTPNITAAGTWLDWSTTPGNPKPNYYATTPLAAANLTDLTATDINDRLGGIYTGGNVLPATKHLHMVQMIAPSTSVAPAIFYLVDYLMYYPFIDMDDTGEQIMTQGSVSLQRYTDGKGVMAFMVATNPYVGGASVTMTYRNQDNNLRIAQTVKTNTIGSIGSIVTAGNDAGSYDPFIPLAPGDIGIRRVESVTLSSPNGGLACIVLCKVLATVYLKEATASSETDFIVDRKNLIRIYDGAYLNFICSPNGSVATVPIKGLVSTIWK